MAPKPTSTTGKCSTFTTSKAPAKPADSFKALDKMVKDNKMCHKVYKKMCPLPCISTRYSNRSIWFILKWWEDCGTLPLWLHLCYACYHFIPMAPKPTSTTGKCSTFTTSKAPAKPADSFKALDKMVRILIRCVTRFTRRCVPCLAYLQGTQTEAYDWS